MTTPRLVQLDDWTVEIRTSAGQSVAVDWFEIVLTVSRLETPLAGSTELRPFPQWWPELQAWLRERYNLDLSAGEVYQLYTAVMNLWEAKKNNPDSTPTSPSGTS